MAITLADFNKIWASTSPLTPYSFSESNYKQGWNFIGSTPPARQMWDFLQKNNDEKMKYLANNYLPLSGGTMKGDITLGTNRKVIGINVILASSSNDGYIQLNGGQGTSDGATIILFGKSEATRKGYFFITAIDGTNSKRLQGQPDGTLTWGGKNIERVNASGTNYIRYENGLQICWGNNQAFDADATPIALPVAFKDATYAVMLGGRGLTGSTNLAISKITAKTTTNFTIRAVATNDLTTFIASTVDYVAIGWWK